MIEDVEFRYCREECRSLYQQSNAPCLMHLYEVRTELDV